MWFNPAQIMQNAGAPTATSASFTYSSTVNDGKVARVAKVATTPEVQTATMIAEQEAAIRAWLSQIGETTPDTIAEIMGKCRTNAEAREYFIRRAEEVLEQNDPDQRNGRERWLGLLRQEGGM